MLANMMLSLSEMYFARKALLYLSFRDLSMSLASFILPRIQMGRRERGCMAS